MITGRNMHLLHHLLQPFKYQWNFIVLLPRCEGDIVFHIPSNYYLIHVVIRTQPGKMLCNLLCLAGDVDARLPQLAFYSDVKIGNYQDFSLLSEEKRSLFLFLLLRRSFHLSVSYVLF